MSDNRTTGQPESEARSGDGGQSGRDIGLFSFFRDYGGIDRSERDSTQQQQQAGGNKSSSGGKKADSSNVRLHLDVLETRSKTPVFVYLVTLCSAVGGFLCGFDMGMISGAMILLRRRFALSLEWQELLVGAAVGSAAVFALLAGIINCHVGRKPIILAVGPIFAVGTVIMAASQNKTLLLIGRIVVGASIGLTSATIPMYIAETVPTSLRGRLVSVNFFMIALGQFVANLIDGLFSSVQHGWRYMFGLGALPGVFLLVGGSFLPESPRWLITQGRDDDARMVLQRSRGEDDIEDEFEAIRMTCLEAERLAKGGSRWRPVLWQMLLRPSVRRALLLGCSFQMIQQLAGINAVMYYSATIIKMAGVTSESLAIWLSAIVSAVNLVFTALGLFLVERVGRRRLTLVSLLGTVLSLVLLAISFQVASLHSPPITFHEGFENPCNTYSSCNQCERDPTCGLCYFDSSSGISNASCSQAHPTDTPYAVEGRCNVTEMVPGQHWAYGYCPTPLAWLSVIGLVLYLIFFAPGMGPMPWTINSEIYPLWARSCGNGAASAINWFFSLLITISFLSFAEVLSRFGVFCLYAVLSAGGLLFLFFCLPETRGLGLEEVEGLFARPWCGSDSQTANQAEKSVQYVHIRGLNRDGRASELDSP